MIKKNILFLLFFFICLDFSQLIAALVVDNNTLEKDANKHYNQGLVYGRQGILDSALWHTQKAIELFEKTNTGNSISLAHAYQSMGIIYKLSGKYDSSLAYYNQAVWGLIVMAFFNVTNVI
jgi:tetratricopeptide (TPR) repeat protein